MLNKHTFCRINGYTVSVDNFSTEKCNISSSDYETCIALNMEMRDRGWYVGTIKYSEIDCIWTENNHEVVDILKGKVKVSIEEFVKRDFNIYKHRSCYAIYKGHKYINYQGYNNDFVYKLGSYDISSQEDGFIMYSPGHFRKSVKPSEIELEFESYMWCLYKGYKFCPSEGSGNNMWIEPYSREEYPNELLISLGFCLKNTKYMKYTSIDEISDLWIINTATGRFKGISIKPEIIKGEIHN